MSIVRAIVLFLILAFGGIVIAAGFMTSPASASKMDGKAGCAFRGIVSADFRGS
ncbi:hypothetical protein ABIF65_011814 [Bradyrhizobium japonicum]